MGQSNVMENSFDNLTAYNAMLAKDMAGKVTIILRRIDCKRPFENKG